MPSETVNPQLIEGVVDGIIGYIQAKLPGAIEVIRVMYPSTPTDPPLEIPAESSYYISEKFIGFTTPAIFVLAQESTHQVEAQFAAQQHRIQVVVLVDVIGDDVAERLTRLTWRYTRALWDVLHDATLPAPAPPTTLVVESVKYSPVLPTKSIEQQVFRKEAWIDVVAYSQEVFG